MNVGGTWDIEVAVACIVHDDRMLLHVRRRPGMPEIDGKLDFPGGKLELGETPAQAAIRETREETGLEVSLEAYVPFQQVNAWAFPNGSTRVRVHCFLARLRAPGPQVVDTALQDSAWAWYPLRPLPPGAALPGIDRFVAWIRDHLAPSAGRPSPFPNERSL